MANACFTAGTPLMVDMEGNSRPIEEIQEGDWVLARSEFDPHGPLELKRVEEKFVRTAAVMELAIGGQKIKTTAEHPFYVPAQERFVPAGELQVGDLLVSSQGTLIPIESISQLNEITTVYNLKVADHHTYFVGGALWGWDVWVHNVLFHYTSAAGIKGMNSSRSIKASKSNYDRHGVESEAVFLTPDPPDVVAKRGLRKYGLTREKAEYVVEVDVPSDKVKTLRGDRDYVVYTTEDIPLPPKGLIGRKSGIGDSK